MTDRPIIFSGPMIRALLDGRKAQTRRVLNPQPVPCLNWGDPPAGTYPSNKIWLRFPYGTGDRLYVRENCATWEGVSRDVIYRADDEEEYRLALADAKHGAKWKGRPSIHMPRWASRLTLTVTDVRVQRLRDISEADAVAEGITGAGLIWGLGVDPPDPARAASPVEAYAHLWNSLHGPKPRNRAGGTLPPRPSPDFTWDANPWVIALTFDVHRGNIDQMEGQANG